MTGMTDPPDTFGSELRRFRQRAGLTQEGLAIKAGLSCDAVGALERGERTHPYPHTVQVLANALGLAQHEYVAFVVAAHARTRGSPEPHP